MDIVVRREIFTRRIKRISIFGRDRFFRGVPVQGMTYPRSYEERTSRYRRPNKSNMRWKARPINLTCHPLGDSQPARSSHIAFVVLVSTVLFGLREYNSRIQSCAQLT